MRLAGRLERYMLARTMGGVGAALAVITAVVPGTVWCELAPDRSAFRLHVFDVEEDDEAFVARFKARYERPLQEIFE
jgi:multicomponent K+:H+ antiporter subunit E